MEKQRLKLVEARDLSHSAEEYMNEGSFDKAIEAYEKIIGILKESVRLTISKETIDQINQKISKYIDLKRQAVTKSKEKQQKNVIMQKKINPHKGQIQILHKQQIKLIPQKQQMKPQEPPKKPQSQQPRQIVVHQAKKPQVPIKKQTQSLDKKKPIVKPVKQIIYPQKKHALHPEKKPQINGKKPAQLNKKPPLKPPHKIQKVIDPSVQELIVRNLDVSFKDIVGLEQAKAILEEAVIRPRKRPDLYVGIRAPPRGLLLYGPPGNGKTFICKALAKQSGCTFIALSASSILNKYVGESQKTIRRIFQTAEKLAPSIIFIDEIDSMLTARTENQNDASRRLKTEFLVLMDGINSPKSGEILVIGATNLPKQLDNAAKRRFSKFIYIGNPENSSRKQMLIRNLKQVEYDLSEHDINRIVECLEYYSASEIRNIISQACMIPLRELKESKFEKISTEDIRKVNVRDFIGVVNQRKPIVSKEQLEKYKDKV